jgi:phosphocarrier protein HPr
MTGRASANEPKREGIAPAGAAALAVEAPAPAPANGAPHRRTIRIVNPLGLHMRIADRFQRAAKQFACVVTVWNGDARADGKNVMDLLMLVALPGAEVVLEVDGPDAPHAVDPLTEILASPGGEDYTI